MADPNVRREREDRVDPRDAPCNEPSHRNPGHIGHNIFISYRVFSEWIMALALRLFLQATLHVNVYHDGQCLINGERYRDDGFISGLFENTLNLVIYLISPSSMAHLTVAHKDVDNVALEMNGGLQRFADARSRDVDICPIALGNLNFAADLNPELYADQPLLFPEGYPRTSSMTVKGINFSTGSISFSLLQT